MNARDSIIIYSINKYVELLSISIFIGAFWKLLTVRKRSNTRWTKSLFAFPRTSLKYNGSKAPSKIFLNSSKSFSMIKESPILHSCTKFTCFKTTQQPRPNVAPAVHFYNGPIPMANLFSLNWITIIPIPNRHKGTPN